MKEKDIESDLVKNLSKIERGIILVERQKRVDTGVIDLFCKDKEGKYVIVEIKREPDTKVIVQLAKYNMALINGGLNKKRLRTILVSLEIPNAVKAACEFFNFEIKKIYKERTITQKRESKNKFKVPNKEELLMFIKKNHYVNLSMIAKRFGIYGATASELVDYLRENNLVSITKLGSSKIVRLK